jgi:hypothetical protein
MSTNHCPLTERLVTSGGDSLEPSLRDHVTGCRSCQDALLVSRALAAAAEDDAPLPDPRVLWLRARSQARARAARRASRLIDAVQVMAAILAAGGLTAAAIAFGPTVGGVLAEVSGGLIATPGLFGLPLLAIAAGIAFLVSPLVALADRV